MNIVLIGMRGTGKTTVGRILSEKLERPFFETDAMLERKSGMSIQEYVAKNGWDAFRVLESKIVGSLANQTSAVIATGGGVVLRKENVASLKKNGKFFLLIADTDTMLKRIGDDPHRPSLTGKTSRREDIEKTWSSRDAIYKKAANTEIDTSKKSPEEVSETILRLYQ